MTDAITGRSSALPDSFSIREATVTSSCSVRPWRSLAPAISRLSVSSRYCPRSLSTTCAALTPISKSYLRGNR
jgi:hypothetical protein